MKFAEEMKFANFKSHTLCKATAFPCLWRSKFSLSWTEHSEIYCLSLRHVGAPVDENTYLDDERDPLQVMPRNRPKLLLQFQWALMVKGLCWAKNNLSFQWPLKWLRQHVHTECALCVCCGNTSLRSCTNQEIENPRWLPWRTEEFPW